MHRRRRQVLRALTVSSVVTLAGCNQTRQGDDDQTGKLFGSSVALSADGTTTIIGDMWYGDTPNDRAAGSAYAFSQADGAWRQQTKLLPNDGDEDDFFGASIALSADGSTAIIGAWHDDTPNGEYAGSAYVFSQTDGAWHQQAKLLPEDEDNDDNLRDFFGGSVAMSADGSTAIVGAERDNNPNGVEAGAAYVFSQADSTWRQQAKLLPKDGGKDDGFGDSVVLSGDGTTAIIGAPEKHNPNGVEGGAAYVFSQTDSTWRQQTQLTISDNDPGDDFGSAVALSGDGTTVIIGAERDNNPNGEDAGSAYAFSQADGSWRQQAKLLPKDGDKGDWFGDSVALSGDGTTAIIGAPRKYNPNGEGAAYVFSQADSTWRQQTKLLPTDGDGYGSFGNSVALSGDGTTAIIGSPPANWGGGSAYAFSQADGAWRQQTTLLPQKR